MRIGVLEHRIQLLQLDPGVLRREPPAHLRFCSVSMFLPRSDFRSQHRHFVDPAVEALAGKDAQLRLCHVQPTAVLGRVVDLQSLPQPPRLRGGKRLVQCPTRVGIQVVADQDQALRLRIVLLQESLDAPRPFDLATLRRDPHAPPTAQRLEEHEEVRHPFALVFVVHTARPARRHLHRGPRLRDELLARLVHADDGSKRIVRTFVDFKDVLHLPDELGVGLGRDAPHLDQPRLQLVFLSVRRIVSWETVSTWPSSTSLSAKRRSVHRHRPAGGLPQAKAMRWASCSPSSIRGRRGTGRRTRTPSRPPSTNERRTLWTVIPPRSRASLICSSDHAGPRGLQSALSIILALVNLRAAALPFATSDSNVPRSSTDKRTTNFLFMIRTPSQNPG